MAITAFTSPVTGLWPLGKFTIVTPGTTVDLNSIVGPQTQTNAGRLTGEGRVLKLIPGSSNTGAIYLLRKVKGQTVSAAGTPNFIVDIVYPGQQSLSPFNIAPSINPDDYTFDADTAGNTVNAVLYFG